MKCNRQTLIFILGTLLALFALYYFSPMIEGLTTNYTSCDNINTLTNPADRTCKNCTSACINKVGCGVCYWNQNAPATSKCSSFKDAGYSKICPK
jgi:hypothetical protein